MLLSHSKCQPLPDTRKVIVRPRLQPGAMAVGLSAILTAGMVAGLSSSKIVAAFGDARTISMYNIHNKESLTVLYKRDGNYIPSAMKKLNWLMRDWRRDVAIKIDPKLIDIIWELHSELGSKRPVYLISGYRSAKTNARLRRSRGGQAKKSRHIVGSAADIHFPDVPVRRMRYAALIREQGGVGYYPTSALPFVHVDTGRVRHWPRMGRTELALLTKGRSRHRPRSGGRLSPRDYERAKKKNASLARRIAAFHAERSVDRQPTAVASLDTRSPKNWIIPSPQPATAQRIRKPAKQIAALTRPVVAARPKPVSVPAPAQPVATISAFDVPKPVLANLPSIAVPSRNVFKGPTKLPPVSELQTADAAESPAAQPTWSPRVEVASINPQAGFDVLTPESEHKPRSLLTAFFELTGWATAPEYDVEHPAELSYRPFPIEPLLISDTSIDAPVLSRLVHPDLFGARDLIGGGDQDVPLRFKPGLQYAEMLWSDIFAGNGVNAWLAGDPALRPWAQQTRVVRP